MRGKLELDSIAPADLAAHGAARVQNRTVTDREEMMQMRVRRSVFWVVGLLVVLVAGSAQPQGNIDAGKTPAQMFADTCSTCHRRPQELRRGASAGFLRQHYMSGSQEAAAMAAYLAGVPKDARGTKDRVKDRLEKSKQAHDKTKASPPPKGRRAAELSKASPEPEPPEAPQETSQHVEAPAVPKLQPFEE